MERTARKPRVSTLLLMILALLLVAGIAIGIYFLTQPEKSREPSRGTYVIAPYSEVIRY